LSRSVLFVRPYCVTKICRWLCAFLLRYFANVICTVIRDKFGTSLSVNFTSLLVPIILHGRMDYLFCKRLLPGTGRIPLSDPVERAHCESYHLLRLRSGYRFPSNPSITMMFLKFCRCFFGNYQFIIPFYGSLNLLTVFNWVFYIKGVCFFAFIFF
jgi:hypothetical protein